MVFIYVLHCKEDSYYIGKTNNPEFRVENHIENAGSSFTKKYPVIRLHELKPNCDDFDEDKYVKIYMSKFGIDKVRGGSYSKLVLDKKDIEYLKKEIRGASDECFNCGGKHFATDCPNKKNDTSFEVSDYNNKQVKKEIAKTGRSKCQKCKEFICKGEYRIGEESSYRGNLTTKWFHEKCHISYSTPQDVACYKKPTKDKICYRCGREGHYADNCYAKKHINGSYINDYESSEEDEICYRCGREGHYADNCYAKKHINGSYINN